MFSFRFERRVANNKILRKYKKDQANFKISCNTLRNKHPGDPGHPTTLFPEDEQAIINALSLMSQIGN